MALRGTSYYSFILPRVMYAKDIYFKLGYNFRPWILQVPRSKIFVEDTRFELVVRFNPHAPLAGECLQPLSQSSICVHLLTLSTIYHYVQKVKSSNFSNTIILAVQ